jgi:hypothetical protein
MWAMMQKLRMYGEAFSVILTKPTDCIRLFDCCQRNDPFAHPIEGIMMK